MPNINDSFPSNYLKASDLQGRSVVVTIDRVAFEPVGRDREMKAVIYFIGKEKGVVLNKTNARKIIEVTGSALTEDWQGHAIVIYPTETEFAGESVECIRVKPVNKAAMGRMTPNPPPAARRTTPDHEYAVERMPARDTDDHSAPLDDSDIPF